MAEMRGVLRRVERNEKGYVWIDIEGFRYEAPGVDEGRFSRWRSLIDKRVVAVVHPWPIRLGDGKVRIVGKVSGLYEDGGTP
jgi:hypothetical protein